MKTLIKSDLENMLIASKSRAAISLAPTGVEFEDFGAKKGVFPKPRKINGNMDLLKKFRYNFHYWLKNCY